MSDEVGAACRFCDEGLPVAPSLCDMSGMDVEMYLQMCVAIGEEVRRFAEIVVENGGSETAEFKVNYCPMCGRDLRGES